jgi:hypothetical protein
VAALKDRPAVSEDRAGSAQSDSRNPVEHHAADNHAIADPIKSDAPLPPGVSVAMNRPTQNVHSGLWAGLASPLYGRGGFHTDQTSSSARRLAGLHEEACEREWDDFVMRPV